MLKMAHEFRFAHPAPQRYDRLTGIICRRSMPMVKRIAASSGDHVCHVGQSVSINGQLGLGANPLRTADISPLAPPTCSRCIGATAIKKSSPPPMPVRGHFDYFLLRQRSLAAKL